MLAFQTLHEPVPPDVSLSISHRRELMHLPGRGVEVEIDRRGVRRRSEPHIGLVVAHPGGVAVGPEDLPGHGVCREGRGDGSAGSQRHIDAISGVCAAKLSVPHSGSTNQVRSAGALAPNSSPTNPSFGRAVCTISRTATSASMSASVAKSFPVFRWRPTGDPYHFSSTSASATAAAVATSTSPGDATSTHRAPRRSSHPPARSHARTHCGKVGRVCGIALRQQLRGLRMRQMANSWRQAHVEPAKSTLRGCHRQGRGERLTVRALLAYRA